MNGQQFRAILWLHWRLRINQLKRAGTLNAVLLAIGAGAALLFAFILCGILFSVGLFALANASAPVVLLVWDGVVLAFLFCWAIGLVTELQRSEVLRLEKFLHLPVSLTGAFLVNYVSSLLSLTLIIFVPAMVGLALGLVFAKGPALLLAFPLLAAFLLMVTAVTYQFQGWLASLMVNQRRRRTIIVLVTGAFILICQVPNLLNVLRPWQQQQGDLNKQLILEQAQLQRSLAERKISQDEYQRRQQAIVKEHKAQIEDMNRQSWEQVQSTARFLSLILPPGWLPLGVMSSVEGQVLPALLGFLGMSLIGAASLWRAYTTTVRLYTGQFSSGKRRAAPAPPPPQTASAQPTLLERRLPGLSEHAAAISLSTFRSLLRAPEVKMMLLSPIILLVVFGGMMVRQRSTVADAFPPLMAFGAMSMVLLCMVQLMGNLFGFDRSGFRVFVLCPARRREILLGKNLAFAPIVLGFGLAATCLIAVLYRMRLSYLFAMVPQLVSMYVLFCLLANCVSILAPLGVASGSFKPTNYKAIHFLLHVAFLFVYPLVLGPTLLPLGVQFVLEKMGWLQGVPICLLLSVVECVAVVYLYRFVLTWEGELLQAREQSILEIVAAKAE
jgi:ABC-2 type transport system permease protein